MVGNAKQIPAGQQQLDGWMGLPYGRGLHECELDRRALFPQPPRPPVEGVRFQSSSTTVGRDGFPARLLLCDSLAAQLTPLLCIAHSSTVRLPHEFG